MTTRTIDLISSANLVVRELLALKPHERLAIIADPMSEQGMVYALAGIAAGMGVEYTVFTQPTRAPERKNELSPMIAAALESADVMIGITSSGGAPTYSKVVKRLLDERRLRVMSMVMRDVEIFTRGGALTDYSALLENGKKLAAIWGQGGTMRIQTPGGTDISAPVCGEDVVIECGYATEPGQEAAFSDGEVSSRPVEGAAEGVIVVDGPMAVLGLPSSPIELEVRGGKVISVNGRGSEVAELRRLISEVKNADNIAEFGIGLNPDCRRNGRFEEEKKALGNVHIAIGDNIFYGGTVESKIHIDMVMYRPTVTLGDTMLVDAGRLTF